MCFGARTVVHKPDHGEHGETDARELVAQAKAHGYNPPKRERILQWQAEQAFPICPTPLDPSRCNVYRELRVPDYWEERAEAR